MFAVNLSRTFSVQWPREKFSFCHVFFPAPFHAYNHPRCPLHGQILVSIVLSLPLAAWSSVIKSSYTDYRMEKLSPLGILREMDDEASLSRSHETHEFREKDEVDSMDSQNPQTWSSTRKTLLFASLMSSSLLADGYAISEFV